MWGFISTRRFLMQASSHWFCFTIWKKLIAHFIEQKWCRAFLSLVQTFELKSINQYLVTINQNLFTFITRSILLWADARNICQLVHQPFLNCLGFDVLKFAKLCCKIIINTNLKNSATIWKKNHLSGRNSSLNWAKFLLQITFFFQSIGKNSGFFGRRGLT